MASILRRHFHFLRGMQSVVYRFRSNSYTVYPKKYAHGFCFAVLCCGYTLTDFPISIRLTSLELWQSNDCPSASKATLMNMDKYFMWIHYERLHNHNKAKHNKTVCIFLGIYCNIFILECLSRAILLTAIGWLVKRSHPCPKFNGSSTKPQFKSWYERWITAHRNFVCYYLYIYIYIYIYTYIYDVSQLIFVHERGPYLLKTTRGIRLPNRYDTVSKFSMAHWHSSELDAAAPHGEAFMLLRMLKCSFW